MIIEALNSVLVNKSQVDATLNAEVEKEAAEERNFDWLNECSELIKGNSNFSKTSTDAASQLDLSTQDGGWRSNNFSFLTNSNYSSNSKYSNLKSFSLDTGETYTTARDNLVKSLKDQLTEAKNTLSRLEAEQTAAKRNAKNNMMVYLMQGGEMNQQAMAAFQSQGQEYDSKIKMQKVTISNLEARLQKVEKQESDN